MSEIPMYRVMREGPQYRAALDERVDKARASRQPFRARCVLL